MRQGLARVEADVALCRRCYGSEPRWPARFERPDGRGRVLVLVERPPRPVLEREERIGLRCADPATGFLRRMVKESGIPPGEVLVGAAVLCRPRSADLERIVPPSVCGRECAAHVRELITAVQPRLVVPLGAAALRSVRASFPDRAVLARLRFPASVGRTAVAGATYFHPLYHVTSRARVTRPEEAQRRDWRGLGRLWTWIAAGGGPAPP